MINDKITIIPFYGGGKGQSLQIIEKPDGQITTTIIKTPHIDQEEEDDIENKINTSELENPPLPTKFDLEDFGDNLRKIQNLAQNIITLQGILKENGKLNPTQEATYKENLNTLSESALKLAEFQENINPVALENREGISAWLENKKNNSNKNKSKKKESDEKKKEEEKKRKLEEEKKRKLEEEKKKEEEKRKQEQLEAQKKKDKNSQKEGEHEGEKEEGEKEEEGDAVGIGLPSDDASVAEAKPVGLAIAGEGGVAASKPIATAVVGPGGLAIARPIGTAIAGVDPAQALIPVHVENYVLGSKTKGHTETANEYLTRLINKFHQN